MNPSSRGNGPQVGPVPMRISEIKANHYACAKSGTNCEDEQSLYNPSAPGMVESLMGAAEALWNWEGPGHEAINKATGKPLDNPLALRQEIGLGILTLKLPMGAAPKTRGMHKFTGDFLPAIENAAGGRVILASGEIGPTQVRTVVELELMRGNSVKVLTGAHGYADGTMKPLAQFFEDDVAMFSSQDYSLVEVLDVMAMSPAQRSEILEKSKSSVVGAMCNSNVCLPGK